MYRIVYLPLIPSLIKTSQLLVIFLINSTPENGIDLVAINYCNLDIAIDYCSY